MIYQKEELSGEISKITIDFIFCVKLSREKEASELSAKIRNINSVRDNDECL